MRGKLKLDWESLLCTSIKYLFLVPIFWVIWVIVYSATSSRLNQVVKIIGWWFKRNYCVHFVWRSVLNVSRIVLLFLIQKWSDYNKRHIITLLTWARLRSRSWLLRLSATVTCPEVSDKNISVSYITSPFLIFFLLVIAFDCGMQQTYNGIGFIWCVCFCN